MSKLSAESRTWLEFQTTLGGDSHLGAASREALALIEELNAREARVRAVLPELSRLGRGLVKNALDGPPRCESRSDGDTGARCAYPVGHDRITHRGVYISSLGDYAHANEGAGVWWNER